MSPRKYDDYSREELIRLLQSRDEEAKTRFGLVWETNQIERDKTFNDDFVALDLDPGLSCNPAAQQGPWRNLIIEGDNYDALRYLKMTFAGRVKCIYIDPPYNTGNRDFVYNDRFVDREDLWRHSTWVGFIHQRLLLAKEILRDDGCIFVSIDDTEVAPLKLLMERVFGTSKFIATLVWKSRQNKDNRNKTGVSVDHEYVLCFGRQLRGEARDQSQYSNPDDDPRGDWTSGNMVGLATKAQRPNLHYDLINPLTGVNYGCPEKGWRYGKDTMGELVAKGCLLWPNDPKGRPREKVFLRDLGTDRTGYPSLIGTGIHTRDGSAELRRIFDGREVFSFPKPSALILELLEQAVGDDKRAIVLDFFAGSGTSAHALMRLNAADEGQRRFILVSSTEATSDRADRNVCRDICATRVRRVLEGYKENPPLGGDFAYLRCRRIPVGQLTDIDHAQVWTALQLTHCPALAPFDNQALVLTAPTEEEGGLLVYVPHLDPASSRALKQAARDAVTAVVYTWQPDLARLRLKTASNVQIEAVPESLARRFGVRL